MNRTDQLHLLVASLTPEFVATLRRLHPELKLTVEDQRELRKTADNVVESWQGDYDKHGSP